MFFMECRKKKNPFLRTKKDSGIRCLHCWWTYPYHIRTSPYWYHRTFLQSGSGGKSHKNKGIAQVTAMPFIISSIFGFIHPWRSLLLHSPPLLSSARSLPQTLAPPWPAEERCHHGRVTRHEFSDFLHSSFVKRGGRPWIPVQRYFTDKEPYPHKFLRVDIAFLFTIL